jgi:hypothetical protein
MSSMRLRLGRSSVVTLLLAALALVSPGAAAGKQGSLFQRVTRAMQSVGSALSSASGDGSAAASAVGDVGEAVASMLEGQAAAGEGVGVGVDTWATDGALKLAMRALNGDQFGVLRQLGQQEELKEIFSQPEAVRALLDNFTMFRGIKKMAAIAEKEGPLTPEDVSLSVLCLCV